jgi:hypothetical protein
MESRITLLVHTIGVCPILKKFLHNGNMPVGRSNVEGCISFLEMN